MTNPGNNPIEREKREAEAEVQSELRQRQSEVLSEMRAPDDRLLGSDRSGLVQRLVRMVTRR
ncbi:MAG: hypothetical protein HUU14_11005 [Dehalococcoidia bacterium]|nr:hypothetical protein [Chloroflexi bacterium CFX7]MCK6563406.1 hypothetical protein [Dehalococcoidia bacterium]NUQ56404.1 hypothetical protein [Dehalococcoidia bacterium]